MQDKTKKNTDICDVFYIEEDKVRKFINKVPDMSDLAELFKVLADETRAKIVYLLSKEELCVCDIAAILGTTVSNVSHHLRLLRTTRLVKFRRDGRQVFYTLDDEHVVHIIKEGFEHVEHTKKDR